MRLLSWRSSAKGRFHFSAGCFPLIHTTVELYNISRGRLWHFLHNLFCILPSVVAGKLDKSACALFTFLLRSTTALNQIPINLDPMLESILILWKWGWRIVLQGVCTGFFQDRRFWKPQRPVMHTSMWWGLQMLRATDDNNRNRSQHVYTGITQWDIKACV